MAASPIDLSGLPGQVTALAFDGQRLILGVTSADSGGIYPASATAGIQRIAASGSPSAIALAGGSLYFADSQSQQIVQVQAYAGTPSAAVFANDSGIRSPAGCRFPRTGSGCSLPTPATTNWRSTISPRASPIQSLDLAYTPTRLDRFGDSSVFLMNASVPGPLYVVRDGGAGKAAVYFVPAQGKPVLRGRPSGPCKLAVLQVPWRQPGLLGQDLHSCRAERRPVMVSEQYVLPPGTCQDAVRRAALAL
jgi:hypothetical protein